jgi:hypothetical protein
MEMKWWWWKWWWGAAAAAEKAEGGATMTKLSAAVSRCRRKLEMRMAAGGQSDGKTQKSGN